MMNIDDPEEVLRDADKEDFATAITLVTAKIYSLVDYKRTRKDPVSAPFCTMIKKLLDYVNKVTLDTYKKNIQLETKLETSANYMQAIQNLSERIAQRPL